MLLTDYDINKKNNNGMSYIHFSVMYKNEKVTTLLLELGIVAGILLLVLLISFANKMNQNSER